MDWIKGIALEWKVLDSQVNNDPKDVSKPRLKSQELRLFLKVIFYELIFLCMFNGNSEFLLAIFTNV